MIYQIKKRRVRANKVSGFTLLELIAVAAILVVIITLAVPLFRKTFTGLQLRNFVSDCVSFCRYAQAEAIIKRNTQRIAFDPEKKYMKIQSMDGETQWQTAKLKRIPASISVELQGLEGDVKFYPDGTADKGLIKIGIPSKYYAISIEPATGYVKVEELTE